jgi:hypothetical protein
MIRFLLLHRIDLTDRHPNVMLAALAVLIVLRAALETVL